ncbi:hypothetical protein [Klebsiella variicola]
MGEISVKTGNNARNGGKNSLNRLIRCVCGKKIGPDPRNFNQRVSLGRNDLLIRTFPKERDFINNAIYEEMKIKGRKLVKCEMKEVLKIARKKILNNRISCQIKKERDKERHAVVFEWKRPETFRR